MFVAFSDETHCASIYVRISIQYNQMHEKLQNSAITVDPVNPQGLFIVTI